MIDCWLRMRNYNYWKLWYDVLDYRVVAGNDKVLKVIEARDACPLWVGQSSHPRGRRQYIDIHKSSLIIEFIGYSGMCGLSQRWMTIPPYNGMVVPFKWKEWSSLIREQSSPREGRHVVLKAHEWSFAFLQC